MNGRQVASRTLPHTKSGSIPKRPTREEYDPKGEDDDTSDTD